MFEISSMMWLCVLDLWFSLVIDLRLVSMLDLVILLLVLLKVVCKVLLVICVVSWGWCVMYWLNLVSVVLEILLWWLVFIGVFSLLEVSIFV